VSIPSLKSSSCNHSYFFDVPFCKSQTLIKKIGTVALHVLTLGIPYIVCRVIPYCGAKIASGVKYAFHLVARKGVESVSQDKKAVDSESEEATEIKKQLALTFARKFLEQNPVDTRFGNKTPEGPEAHLHEIAAFRELLTENLLQKYRSSSGEEKLEAASDCLKMSYALFHLKVYRNEILKQSFFQDSQLLMSMNDSIKDIEGRWSVHEKLLFWYVSEASI